ncbi:MAG TPA: 30S ribosomal protein S4 [Longimicrobiaceae bacterium]|nr:30S ribosomal protein S4 [Longimicrobiaceae bacterium]
MGTARLKVIRRLGTPLPGLTRKEPRGQAAGPVRHGRTHRRPSDYRRQLEEKQKVRFHYGIGEIQLRRAFRAARSAPGATGEALLVDLERRLDSVVFRLGFAPTIRAARQLVAHGHVRVDGRRVDRPAYRVSRGEEITLTARGREIPDVVAAVERGPEVRLPGFLALDGGHAGRVLCEPSRGDVPFLVDEAAIVEFYAR